MPKHGLAIPLNWKLLQTCLFIGCVLILFASPAAGAPRILQSTSVQSPPCNPPGQPTANCGTGFNQLTITFAPTTPGSAVRLIYIGGFQTANRVCTDNLGNQWSNNFGASDRGGISIYGAPSQSLAKAGVTSITCVGGIISGFDGPGPFDIVGFSSLQFIELSGVPGGAFIDPFEPGVNSSPVSCVGQTGFELMILRAFADSPVQFSPQAVDVQPLFDIPNANATVFYEPHGTGQLFNFSPSPLAGFGPAFCISLGFPFAELLDPAPQLMNGTTVLGVSDPLPDGPGINNLAVMGRPIQGAAADGVTQLLIRVSAQNPGDQVTVRVFSDQGVLSSSADEDGALGNPGDASSSISQNQITVTAVSSPGGAFAFAVYRVPLDFARNSGADDNSAFRKITLQVAVGFSLVENIPVTIVRPPVALVHGLWGNWKDAWNDFSPLVNGTSKVDSKFSVLRVNYDSLIGPRISATDPPFPAKRIQKIKANSLGFAFNAPNVYSQMLGWLRNFRNGQNPAHLPVAASRLDVVAHSMGGVISRTMTLNDGYLAKSNFGQGLIHKLITIDTPHLGSAVASLLLAPENSCTRNFMGRFGSFALNTATIDGIAIPGAVGDLTLGSNALQAIQALNPNPGTPPIPTAMIAGVYTNWPSLDQTRNLSDFTLFVLCRSDAIVQDLTSTGWPALFAATGDQRNDALVSVTSELNGLGDAAGSIEQGFVHSTALTGITGLGFTRPSVLDANTDVSNLVEILLNVGLPNGATFKNLGPSSQ